MGRGQIVAAPRPTFGMSISDHDVDSAPGMSRRELFGAVVAVGGCSALGVSFAPAFGAAAPIVSFHRDAPYVDRTGRAEPYRPRIATDWADGLDDEALIRLGQIF
jgi:hypothetical protein